MNTRFEISLKSALFWIFISLLSGGISFVVAYQVAGWQQRRFATKARWLMELLQKDYDRHTGFEQPYGKEDFPLDGNP